MAIATAVCKERREKTDFSMTKIDYSVNTNCDYCFFVFHKTVAIVMCMCVFFLMTLKKRGPVEYCVTSKYTVRRGKLRLYVCRYILFDILLVVIVSFLFQKSVIYMLLWHSYLNANVKIVHRTLPADYCIIITLWEISLWT